MSNKHCKAKGRRSRSSQAQHIWCVPYKVQIWYKVCLHQRSKSFRSSHEASENTGMKSSTADKQMVIPFSNLLHPKTATCTEHAVKRSKVKIIRLHNSDTGNVP